MNRWLALALVAGCVGSRPPDTRYYQLAPPHGSTSGGDMTLAIEPLATEQAYDDERIVYRTTPYRLDYYEYHRWSAAPGTLVGDYLEQAFEHSGRFKAVTRETTADIPAVLGGRVVAIEEVDTSRTRWIGRIVVELAVTDVHTNKVVWTHQYEETEPLVRQSPEGLAQAISTAMARISEKAAPEIEAAIRSAQLNASR